MIENILDTVGTLRLSKKIGHLKFYQVWPIGQVIVILVNVIVKDILNY